MFVGADNAMAWYSDPDPPEDIILGSLSTLILRNISGSRRLPLHPSTQVQICTAASSGIYFPCSVEMKQALSMHQYLHYYIIIYYNRRLSC